MGEVKEKERGGREREFMSRDSIRRPYVGCAGMIAIQPTST